MSLPVVPIVVIGGAAYALTQMDSTVPGAATQGPLTHPTTAAQHAASRPALASFSSVAKRFGATGAAFTSPTNQSPDPELQKKLDEIEAAAKKAYDDMDDVAKVEAIDKMNQNLGTNLPLDADLSWGDISMAAYGAAGAAAGTAVCGPICGKIGALCAVYLGEKLNDLIAKNWDDLKSYMKKKWNYVSDAVTDAAEDVADAVSDAVSGLNPF